jgi:transcriptional regulator with XRE-family HTH domain
LTQKRLAELAGVSTPTVSHFESGARDVQLSSITRILSVLGMLDERVLTFPDEPRPRFDSPSEVVVFEGRDGDKVVRCRISEEALEDHFGADDSGDGSSLVRAFRANYQRIQKEARRKYLSTPLEADGSVLIRSNDVWRGR